VSEGHWSFADPTPALPGVPGIPLTNFAGWVIAALVVMILVEALAGPAPAAPELWSVPVALLLWVYCSNVLANAVFFGRPAVAVIGGIGMGIPMAVVVRRLREPRPVAPAVAA
jgi:putative membrane protein